MIAFPTITIKADVLGDEEADLARDGGEEDHDHEKGATDPHVWLDPQRARLIVKQIAEELAKADGAHGPGYRERADAIDASLDALDKELDDADEGIDDEGLHHVPRELWLLRGSLQAANSRRDRAVSGFVPRQQVHLEGARAP